MVMTQVSRKAQNLTRVNARLAQKLAYVITDHIMDDIWHTTFYLEPTIN